MEFSPALSLGLYGEYVRNQDNATWRAKLEKELTGLKQLLTYENVWELNKQRDEITRQYEDELTGFKSMAIDEIQTLEATNAKMRQDYAEDIENYIDENAKYIADIKTQHKQQSYENDQQYKYEMHSLKSYFQDRLTARDQKLKANMRRITGLRGSLSKSKDLLEEAKYSVAASAVGKGGYLILNTYDNIMQKPRNWEDVINTLKEVTTEDIIIKRLTRPNYDKWLKRENQDILHPTWFKPFDGTYTFEQAFNMADESHQTYYDMPQLGQMKGIIFGTNPNNQRIMYRALTDMEVLIVMEQDKATEAQAAEEKRRAEDLAAEENFERMADAENAEYDRVTEFNARERKRNTAYIGRPVMTSNPMVSDRWQRLTASSLGKLF